MFAALVVSLWLMHQSGPRFCALVAVGWISAAALNLLAK
jgi:hypothetical protein